MQNHQENTATLEEIVFQNRNKSYGAYSLRTDYQNVIKKSLLIGISISGLAVLTPMLWAKVGSKIDREVIATVTDYDIPEPPKEIEQPKIETPPPVQPEAEVRSQMRFVEPEIVDDSKVTELPPDQDDLNKAINIGTENIEGKDEPIPTEDQMHLNLLNQKCQLQLKQKKKIKYFYPLNKIQNSQVE
jgi:periplasmic protein TonB